jgi:CDP-diacylglycerol--glycerol-3-phosphate 3-phosphatidyltransferase
MTIYDLKKLFQNLLRPLTNALARAGVTANQVTISAMLLSCVGGGFIYASTASSLSLLLVPLVLFVRMALNAIDGMLAREHNMCSRLGAVLNELGDVFSDAVLYLSFTVIKGIPAEAVVVAVLLAVFTEMAGVVAVQIGGTRRYDGPMGKSDRAFVFSCLAILIGVGVPSGMWLTIVLWVIVALLCLTIFSRARRALCECSPVLRGEH